MLKPFEFVSGEATWDVPWGAAVGFGSLLVAFAVYILGEVPYIIVARPLEHSDNLLFEIGAYQCLLLGVAICVVTFIAMHARADPRELGFRFTGWSGLLKALAALPITYVGVLILYGLFSTFLPGYHLQGNTQQLFSGAPKHLPLWEDVIVVLWAAVEAPLVEETLFRGILYQGLRHTFLHYVDYPRAVWAAAIVSGLLFGAAHFEPHTFPILAFLGIALALIFQYVRSIYASMLIHGIVNALAVISVLHP